uniref:Uncharacterized protein n=1 Tax=Arundo donax TaxID=35708 RepID=A0A0A9HQX3_ARUDO
MVVLCLGLGSWEREEAATLVDYWDVYALVYDF